MLHTIGQIVRGLADLVHTQSNNLAHVLQRGFVPLTCLEGLSSPHEGLDVVRLVLQHRCGVSNGVVEVGELLVARGSVVVALDSQLGRLVGDSIQALSVCLDSGFELGILEVCVALLLDALLRVQTRQAVLLGALVLGAHSLHDLVQGLAVGVQTHTGVQSLVGRCDVSLVQVCLCLGDEGLHLPLPQGLLQLSGHALQVGAGGVDAQSALDGVQSSVQVAQVLLSQRGAEVPLHEGFIGDDALAAILCGLGPLAQCCIARTAVGIKGHISGILLNGRGILLNGLGETLGLEKPVSLTF
mmetsp:Transcript_36731/g.75307  ORF Transcript_36731/g.75307 Transcript_36731/m.75307 type:complete len:299 (+) Transcript_36731:189-1085(+)